MKLKKKKKKKNFFFFLIFFFFLKKKYRVGPEFFGSVGEPETQLFFFLALGTAKNEIDFLLWWLYWRWGRGVTGSKCSKV